MEKSLASRAGIPTNTVPLRPQSRSPSSRRASRDGPEAKARRQREALATSAARCLLTALLLHRTHTRPDRQVPLAARTTGNSRARPSLHAGSCTAGCPSQVCAAARPSALQLCPCSQEPAEPLPGRCPQQPSSGKGASARREAPGLPETAPGLSARTARDRPRQRPSRIAHVTQRLFHN